MKMFTHNASFFAHVFLLIRNPLLGYATSPNSRLRNTRQRPKCCNMYEPLFQFSGFQMSGDALQHLLRFLGHVDQLSDLFYALAVKENLLK